VGNRSELREYIQDAQRAMANLSVTDMAVSPWARPAGATYLVFEILNNEPGGNSKYFSPYVSQDLFSGEDTSRAASSFKRALQNLRANSEELSRRNNIPANKWESNGQARDTIQTLIGRYEQTSIPPNMAATAIIYQGWKQGKLRRLGKKLIAEGLFMDRGVDDPDNMQRDVLEHMAEGFGLDSWSLGETVIDGQRWVGELPDKEHQWIEFSLIHKTDVNNAERFKLIHYPIILYGYWFVGFAYTFKVGREGQRAEIFRRDKYLKCLSVLVESSALTLKRGLINYVLNSLHWGESIDDETKVRAANLFMSCFDFALDSAGRGELRTTFNSYVSFPELNIRMYAPDWVTGDEAISKSIAAELTQLFGEIHKRHKEVMYFREQERADIGAGMFHNMVHYTLPLEVYSHNIPRYIKNNDLNMAVGYAVYVDRAAKRMSGFINAVQAYIKPSNKLHDSISKPLTNLPLEALSVQVEAINASATVLIKDYNKPIPLKYGLLLGNLFNCDYTTVEGQKLLQKRLKAVNLEQPKLDNPTLKTIMRWMLQLGLNVRVAEENNFAKLRADFATMVVVMEELLLNALEATARARGYFSDDRDRGSLSDVSIEATQATANEPAYILIHNWSDKKLFQEQLTRPEQDKGWGLYGMDLLMRKMGGSLHLVNEPSVGWDPTPPYRVGYKLILPSG
jgi:hypothetical protein